MGKNIMVTGGTGFLGSHLVKDLTGDNRVVVLVRDNISSKWLGEALKGAILVKGDILDTDLVQRVLSDYLIEEVYHLAAQAVLKSVIKDPLTAIKVNVVGAASVLEACRRTEKDIHIIVQTTDKVYEWSKLYVTEKDPLGSVNGIYEASKVAEDTIARAYENIFGINLRITRPSNIYGYDLSSRIIPNTIKDCLHGIRPVIFVGQEKMIRNYLYVADFVSAIELVMKQPNGIFNIGTPDVLTQEETVKKIAKLFNLEPIYKVRDRPMKEIQEQAVNYDKLMALGWKPKYSFDEGIAETIARYKKYGC
jgi:nucleoside-diphosphate-sugar epimerase